jgi:hypothetical protein
VELQETIMPFTKGEKYMRSFSDMASVKPKAEDVDFSLQKNKIPVLLKSSGYSWKIAQLHGVSDESYVLSVDGNEPKAYPINKTEIIEDLPPIISDVHLLEVVLCKNEQQWESGVVVEINENKLICLHMHYGEEKAVYVQNLRKISGNNNAKIGDVLSSKLLFLQGFISAAASDSGVKASTPGVTPPSFSNVSKEQFEATITTLFNNADVDKSGELSYDEVKTLSASMGLIMNNSAWAKILKAMDTDGNKSISRSELITFWGKWYSEKGPGATLEQKEEVKTEEPPTDKKKRFWQRKADTKTQTAKPAKPKAQYRSRG